MNKDKERKLYSQIAFDSVLKLTHEGIAILSADGEINRVNARFAEIVQQTEDELIGTRLDSLGIDNNLLREENLEKEHFTMLASATLVGKQHIPIRCSFGKVLFNDEPSYVLNISDLTDIWKLEQELTDSRERYKNLVEQLPAGVYMSTFGRPRHFMFLSPEGERIIGCSFHELEHSNKNFLHWVHPDDRDYLIRKLDSSKENYSGLNAEYRIITNDGQRRWIHEKAKVLHDADGSPLSLQGILLDITHRKQSEIALQNFSFAFEQSPNAAMITNLNKSIKHVNNQFLHLTGYDAKEIEGCSAYIIFPYDGYQKPTKGPVVHSFESKEVKSEIELTLSRGDVWKDEIIYTRRDGTPMWGELTVSPILDSQGQPSHYLYVFVDISDRKEKEKLKEEVERMIRHDLKGPLNGIINIPQMIIDENAAALNEKQQEYLALMRDGGKKILSLVNKTMDIYRMEIGLYPLDPVPVNLPELISRLLLDYHRHIKMKSLSVKVNNSSKDKFLCIYGEELLTYTIFANLLENAIEASPFNSTININITLLDNKVETEITNTGLVDPAIQDTFFEKYTTYGKKHGNGLGTYSAKLLTETQGGTIELSPGDTTTTVKVILPIPM